MTVSRLRRRPQFVQARNFVGLARQTIPGLVRQSHPERAYIYFTASVNQQNGDSINAFSAVPWGSR
jgi:hypothetical protein